METILKILMSIWFMASIYMAGNESANSGFAINLIGLALLAMLAVTIKILTKRGIIKFDNRA